ncbi:MAG: hypothetical protein PHE29_14255, partial [Tissierellia bacterium]|nr:hypothetical protein [Tissierellia bacterium]
MIKQLIFQKVFSSFFLHTLFNNYNGQRGRFLLAIPANKERSRWLLVDLLPKRTVPVGFPVGFLPVGFQLVWFFRKLSTTKCFIRTKRWGR